MHNSQNVHDEYHLLLGRILSKLQSLEFMLRAVLTKLSQHASGTDEPKLTIARYEQGQRVPVDAFTNYESLGQVVERYNSHAADGDRLAKKKIVDLRDCMAHGRIASSAPSYPLTLVKFGPEQNGHVEVQAVITMDRTWFLRVESDLNAALNAILRTARRCGVHYGTA